MLQRFERRLKWVEERSLSKHQPLFKNTSPFRRYSKLGYRLVLASHLSTLRVDRSQSAGVPLAHLIQALTHGLLRFSAAIPLGFRGLAKISVSLGSLERDVGIDARCALELDLRADRIRERLFIVGARLVGGALCLK